MKLSPDYRRVRALFEYVPQQEHVYDYASGKMAVQFAVGPFSYQVELEYELSSTLLVKFSLTDINVTDEQLIEMFSKVAGKKVSLEKAKRMEYEVITKNRYDVLEVVGSDAIKVFGAVLKIIKDFVDRNEPRCIRFESYHKGRTELYKRMIQRFLPGADVRVRDLRGRTEFLICFDWYK